MAQFLTELKSRNQFSTLCCDGISHNALKFILSRSCPVKITEIFSTKSQPYLNSSSITSDQMRLLRTSLNKGKWNVILVALFNTYQWDFVHYLKLKIKSLTASYILKVVCIKNCHRTKLWPNVSLCNFGHCTKVRVLTLIPMPVVISPIKKIA